jgi:hypothetical protein
MTTKTDIIQRIQQHMSADLPLVVLEDHIRQENDWWYVPVRPRSAAPKTFEYYQALAELEERLDEEANLNVLLVPAAE